MTKFNQLSNTTLGQYELKNLLGKGGMGAVYQAYQPSLERDVAIKVLTGDFLEDTSFIQRFTQEAKISASLEHPNIITVHDYGVENDMSYVVMRLLTGGTLETRLSQKGKFAPKETLRLLTPLADALDYAHQKGVLHRDIKPSNIMFDEQNRPYLVDFGLAKLANQNFSLTATSYMIGTPNYMSPEQWKGETLTPASDQYAFATMTYEILTGNMPFDADSTYALMHKHLYEVPPDEATKLSRPIYAVIVRGMAKEADDRYPSMKAFMKALINAVEGTEPSENISAKVNQKIEVKPATPTVPFIIPQKKKSTIGLWIIGGVVILIMTIGVMFALQLRNNSSASDISLPTRVILEDNTPTPIPTEFVPNSVALASAQRAFEAENYRLALQLYNQVILENPNIGRLHYERALVLYALRRRDSALDDIGQAITLYPYAPEPYLLQARILGDSRQFDEALNSLNQYLTLEPSPLAEAIQAQGTLQALTTP